MTHIISSTRLRLESLQKFREDKDDVSEVAERQNADSPVKTLVVEQLTSSYSHHNPYKFEDISEKLNSKYSKHELLLYESACLKYGGK